MEGPIGRFKIWCNRGSSLYYTVNIWRTKKDMQAYVWWFKLGPHCLGLHSPIERIKFDKRGIGRKKRSMGELHFRNGYLYTEILAHEVSHAAINYARRLKLDPFSHKEHDQDTDEEKFCYAHGWMMRQIVNKLYELKLL